MNQNEEPASGGTAEVSSSEKPPADPAKQTSPVLPEPPNLFHQITTDFLTYESRTRTFLKSLLPTSTPRNGDFASDESSGVVSNDSQNLQGFEGCLHESEGGHYHGRGSGSDTDDYDDDDDTWSSGRDGEDCSSNSSGVYNYEFRDRRLRQILAAGSTAGSDRESTDGTPSMHRSRNGSVEPRQSSGGRSRDRMRSGSGRPAMVTNSGPLPIDMIPWDLREQLLKLDARLSSEKDRFVAIDQPRRCAVLRVAKGSLQRAYDLCVKYSQLIDRLGLQMITRTDVEQVLSRNCFMYLAADPKLCKDGRSAVLWISASRLPPVPKEDKKSFEKQEYCTSLLRALLFLLETHRFGGPTARPSQAKRARGRSVNSNSSETTPPAATGGKDEVHHQEQGGETPQQKSAPSRRGAVIDPPPVIILVDVSKTESSKLNALAQVLSTASEWLRSSYPMKVPCVLVSATDSTQFASQGTSTAEFQDPVPPPAPETAPPPPVTATQNAKSPNGKKPFAFVTSLFQKNKSNGSRSDSRAPSGTSSNAGSAELPRTPSVASRMWLSVMMSTWKLRFLPPTLRARTSLTEFSSVVDAVRLTRLLLTTVTKEPQPPSASP